MNNQSTTFLHNRDALLPPDSPTLQITHRFEVGDRLIALQWGRCGHPLRAFTRDGRETVFDTVSGHLIRTTSFTAENTSCVCCRPQTSEFSFLSADGVSGSPDPDTPRFRDVSALSWSPCGRFLAVLAAETLNIWNAEKRKLVTAPHQIRQFGGLAWRENPPDGCGELATGIPGGVLLWAASGSISLHEHPGLAAASVMAWQPGGRYLALGYPDGTARIWNPVAAAITRLQGPAAPITRMEWNEAGSILIAMSGRAISAWSLSAALHNGGQTLGWERRESPMTALAMRGTGRLAAVGHLDGLLELRRMSGGMPLLQALWLPSSIAHLAWSPSGRRLAVGIDGGEVCVVRACR